MCQSGEVVEVARDGLRLEPNRATATMLNFFGPVRFPRGPMKTRARALVLIEAPQNAASVRVCPTANSNNLLLSRWARVGGWEQQQLWRGRRRCLSLAGRRAAGLSNVAHQAAVSPWKKNQLSASRKAGDSATARCTRVGFADALPNSQLTTWPHPTNTILMTHCKSAHNKKCY